HRAPVDREQLADRGAVHLLREVGRHFLEVSSEERPRAGPRDLLHAHSTGRAVDSARDVSKPEPRTPECQVAPLPRRPLVVEGPTTTTLPTSRKTPSRADIHDDALLLEGHRPHEQRADGQELSKYGGNAHGASPFDVSLAPHTF